MKKRLGLIAGSIMLLATAYLFLAYIGVVPAPYTCSSETEKRIVDISGYDFEIVDTDCDALAKEEFVSVYVSKTEGNKNPLLVKLLGRKTLLFRYDPAMWNSPLPLVTASGPNRILVSIPRVSSVLFQRRNWEHILINYDIGHVDYPGTVQSQEAH